MLYLALFFPRLALELAFPPPSASSEPWAIVDRTMRPESVHACNEAATASGIITGQKLSAALALCGSLRVLPRKLDAEQAALDRLAGWAQQFTPTVIVQQPAALLLDIGACLAYFKGLPRLVERVQTGMNELGYTLQWATAPSCHAAFWLARHASGTLVADPARLPAELTSIPMEYLPLSLSQLGKLHLMGIHTLGQLLQLPRGGLARRFGSELPLLLDRALGLAADPRPAFRSPEGFYSRLELTWAADSCSDLLLVARRMLVELCGYLAGRGLGVQIIDIVLEHENRSSTRLSIGFGKPGRQAEALFAILRERFERFELSSTVCAVSLQADHLHALEGVVHDLFGDGRHAEDLDLLHNRLRARLGDEAVCGVAPLADHRPELAWKHVDVGSIHKSLPAARGPRPAWLLHAPQPLSIVEERPWYGEALTCLGRAERIESGWWDTKAVMRDYFTARGLSSGRLFWIFQERNSQQWFMHGLFD